MTKTQAKPLTTEQAIFRARLMISSGQKLRQAAKVVADARTTADQDAVEALKNAELLNFRVGTVTEALQPVQAATSGTEPSSSETSTYTYSSNTIKEQDTRL